VRWERLSALGRELPDVTEGLWYGTAALSVRGRSFVRLKEDGQSVVFRLESLDEQDFLTEARRDVYYVTDHYRGHKAVLARLRRLTVSECRARLKTAWRTVAPKTLLKEADRARLARLAAKAGDSGLGAHGPGPRPRSTRSARPRRRGLRGLEGAPATPSLGQRIDEGSDEKRISIPEKLSGNEERRGGKK
jgi:hypothetical protein